MSRSGRIALVVAAVLAATTAVPLLLATPAEAASYRFWTYWDVAKDGADWRFAQSGASRRPADRTVEGWRFAISPSTRSAPPPRVDGGDAFAAACGDRPAPTGKKRVALYVDFGTAADAPRGSTRPGSVHRSCVETNLGTTGLGVLTEAGFDDVRLKAGMVCGISGYPRSGCGEAVAAPEPSTKAAPPPTRRADSGPTGGTRTRSPRVDRPGSTDAGPRSSGGPTGDTGPGSPAPSSGATGPDMTGRQTAPGSGPPAETAASNGQRPRTGAAPDPLDGELSAGGELPADQDDEVTVVTGPPTSASEGSSPLPLLVAVLIVVLLGGGAFWKARRAR